MYREKHGAPFPFLRKLTGTCFLFFGFLTMLGNESKALMGLFTYLKNLFGKNSIKSMEGLNGWDRVDTMLHNLAAEHKVPGMAVTIEKKGEVVLQKGYGYASLEEKTPVSPQHTVFRIASISKCITGIALVKMQEEGIVHLDDSFYKYVPDYPKKDDDFTLGQLAGHTAGIRGYRGKEYALNRSLSIKDSIEVFKNDPLEFVPGKGYLYNSFDFVLLSLAMEEACGIPFGTYVKQKVLQPLGMNHTLSPNQLEETPEILAHNGLTLADFYTKTRSCFKKAVPVNNAYKLAGGGYLSTSADMAKLGQAVLERRLLPPKQWNQILTSQSVEGKPTYYGVGFQVSQDESGRKFVGHVGNSVGAYSNFFVYPREQLVVTVLINCTDPKVQKELDMALL